MSNSLPIKTKNDEVNMYEEEDKYKPNSNINLKESSDSDSESKKEEKSSDSKSSRNSSSEDCESLSSSIDEERITLGQINKIARRAQKKKEKMDIKSFLKRKRHLDNNVITYDEKKGKIVNEFCGSIEELNEFLNKCEIKKINFDDFSNNQKDSVAFDPNEWMKTNKIMQRTISSHPFTSLIITPVTGLIAKATIVFLLSHYGYCPIAVDLHLLLTVRCR